MQLLKVLRGTDSVPLWRRILGKPEKRLDLRGVIGFCDVQEFTGASADPQRFEKYCRTWQERLRAVGEVIGVVDVEQILDSVFSQFCIGK